jgi:hypothetical protein
LAEPGLPTDEPRIEPTLVSRPEPDPGTGAAVEKVTKEPRMATKTAEARILRGVDIKRYIPDRNERSCNDWLVLSTRKMFKMGCCWGRWILPYKQAKGINTSDAPSTKTNQYRAVMESKGCVRGVPYPEPTTLQ